MSELALQFQFHKGTIKTSRTSNLTRPRKVFQFHKGTIKTEIHYLLPIPYAISIP